MPPYRLWMQVLDWLLLPFMYLLQGNFREVPQRTHFWNNQKYLVTEVKQRFLTNGLVGHGWRKDPHANPPWLFGFIPRFHIPLIGGWTKFAVLEPCDYQGVWHIGWIDDHSCGVSLVPIKGPVRMLLGNYSGLGQKNQLITFFAVDQNGKGIPLDGVGEGRIGSAGEYAHLPLL